MRWLKPSLVEVFFLAVMLAAFGRPQSWQSLLSDGDCGWHIRTGDLILKTGAVPHVDPFSFSRAGQPWFAWEWLSEIIFSLLHRWGGLAAVAGFSVVLLCFTAALLLAWLLRRGAGLWVGVAVSFAVISASTVHYLARPHVFSILFTTAALLLIDEDRRRPGRRVWILVPLSALWANLHGGFVALAVILGLLLAGAAWEREWSQVRRYGLIAALCSAATLINPYGWRLHQHIATYLRSSWILDNVQEFQSPRIRSESMIVFAALLLLGAALSSRAIARRQWFDATLVLAWGFAALRSARHVPLYAIAAAPLVAAECARWWARGAEGRSRGSPVAVFWQLSQELGASRHFGLWTPIFAALGLWVAMPRAAIADFPSAGFPVEAVARHANVLRPARVLTSDQWADYLIYRFSPEQRVFFDGRSDFYGPEVGRDYQALLSVSPDWPKALARYGFDVALLPMDWPLGAVLERDPEWKLVDRDPKFLLLVRQPSRVSRSAKPESDRSGSRAAPESSPPPRPLRPAESWSPRRSPGRGA